MNKLVLIAALSAFSAASFAAPETFNVEPTHTYPRFEYSHFGYSNQQQRFDKTSGKIVIDRAAKTGSVDVSIDTTSVNTGYALFNQHLVHSNRGLSLSNRF
jgi:polyisoprenoid-binding protein YceI